MQILNLIPRRTQRRRNPGRLTGAAALLCLALATPAWSALPAADSQGAPLPTLAPMLERATPAVVNIATAGRVQEQGHPLFSDPFFRHFFDLPGQPRERIIRNLGSGVVVDATNGYIITNSHVIHRAQEIKVTLRDGRTLDAEVVGTDPDTDVAVIKVPAEKLTALPLAIGKPLRVGDFVVAIGNPFGLGQTVTSGIVSALERSGLGIEGYEDFIQTDASINPGNSGGALVNLRGELVGINTAIYSQSGGNIGIGFAIPIKMASDIMAQLVEHGEVRRGVLGAQAQDLTPQLAQAFGIEYQRGAVVTRVRADSPAAAAGLRPGDIVTRINGRKVRDAQTLRTTVGLLRVGDEVRLEVIREGKPHTLTARIAEHRQETRAGGKIHPHLEGATLAEIPPDSPLYGRVEGVMILEVESRSTARAAGLHAGDLIVAANRKAVTDLDSLARLTGKSRSLMLKIVRGDTSYVVYLQ